MEVATSGKTLTLKTYDLDLRGNLTLSSGILDSGTQDIYIYGNWVTNSGTFNYNTQLVYFRGTTAQQISGTSASMFYDLTLFNSSGLSFSQSTGIVTTVMHTLTLSQGKITLGNFDLNIGSNGVSGDNISAASSSRYIITDGIGVLRQYNMGTGGAGLRQTVTYPVGTASTYNPVTISMSGTSTPDDFSVRVSPSVLANGTSGSAYTAYVVDRTWEVSEGTAGGSSVKIEVNWNAAEELPSFSRTNCYVSHYESGIWSSTGPGASGNSFKITSGTVTSFSPFAVASNTVLPVELIGFQAIQQQGKVMLNWQTLTEINNKEFTIQRSADGLQFENLFNIAGAGNSQTLLSYKVTDEQPLTGTSYYRLMQTDFNGAFSYSNVQAVDVQSLQRISTFPNPAGNVLQVSLEDTEAADEYISIYDNTGLLVYTCIYHKQEGKEEFNLDLHMLKPGLYHLNCVSGSKHLQTEFIHN